MSKDKGSKDKKKAPSTEGKKAPSDYQSGKSSAARTEIISAPKKNK